MNRRRVLRPTMTLVIAVCLLPISFALALMQNSRAREQLHETLNSEVQEQVAKLENYFERARSINLLTAHNPAFGQFYESPGARLEKVKSGGVAVDGAYRALEYLQVLYPKNIGEACFIDRTGPQNAQVVRGRWAPFDDLSSDKSDASFFGPTFAQPFNRVYQSAPYESPATGEWVIANSTLVPTQPGERRAIVHFEVTIESFRREMAGSSQDSIVRVVDAATGNVIIDSRFEQKLGTELGRPTDRALAFISDTDRESGMTQIDDRPSAFQRIDSAPGNVNEWYVMTSARQPLTLLQGIGAGPIGMIVASIVLLIFAVSNFRSYQGTLHHAALNDPLTGLGNRRKLMIDLAQILNRLTPEDPFVLALLDLDGFKAYNDTFGHPAGDALLVRLGRSLLAEVNSIGDVYRMGGDEFCVLARLGKSSLEVIRTRAADALSERGDGFHITASCGAILLPQDASDASAALRLADRHMYANKRTSRGSVERQSKDVLLEALFQRVPDLHDHLAATSELAEMVGRELRMPSDAVEQLRQAAELHDVGKLAIPESILNKPGPLDDDDWAFIRRHTLIGEKILSAAPALLPVARIVRSSHERYDGIGYPDGLAGDEIPLGARIIFVCDAFDAMTADRPYRKAMSTKAAIGELRRNAGTQFDPVVVETFCNALLGARAPAAR